MPLRRLRSSLDPKESVLKLVYDQADDSAPGQTQHVMHIRCVRPGQLPTETGGPAEFGVSTEAE